MHASHRRLIVLVSVLFTAYCAHAQWKSVHANLTKITSITPVGGLTQTNTTTSEYFRSTSGSELTVTVTRTPDGSFVRKFATLYDADEPAQYSVDYGTKTAYLMARMSTSKPFITGRSERHPELKHANYEGIDCVLVPVMSEGKRIGTYWVDDKDDLVVKKDITLPGSHTVTELSDISIGSKVDPRMFRIPADFAIDTARDKALPSE